MPDADRPLAANLRRARTSAGLSVVELARRAGVGRATLTQLEAGVGNPTLETLYALADVLGVALADLIADPEPGGEPRVLRRGQGRHTRGAVVEGWLLHRRRTSGVTVELYAVTLHGGPVQSSRAHPAGTRECLHLHTGRVQVGPAEAPLHLAAGDYAEYPADGTHIYQALPADPQDGQPGQATATLMIITPAPDA